MNINSLKYCMRQSYVSITRNIWLAVVTASIIAISLAILGGFLLVAINANQFIRSIESNVEIGVFLEEDVDLELIKNQLAELDGVDSYAYVPKEQGLKDFSRTIGDRVPLTGLEGNNNPLPDIFRVRAIHTEAVPALAGEIKNFPGVEMVDYGETMVNRLLKITSWLKTLFLSISFLLGLGAVFLIVTTIRLSVLARQDEISIMKYMGASNWFIRFPFIIEGVVMGWMGTIVATVTLCFTYYRVTGFLRQEVLIFFLQPVTDPLRLIPLMVGLLVLGTLMGGIGSLVSIRKFMQV